MLEGGCYVRLVVLKSLCLFRCCMGESVVVVDVMLFELTRKKQNVLCSIQTLEKCMS